MIDNRSCYDSGTQSVARYIKGKGISMAAISRGTGITMGKLQRSIGDEKRPLRTEEFLSICAFLEVEPMKFWDGNKSAS